MKRLLAVLAVVALSASAQAQLALPGSAGDGAKPAKDDARPARHRRVRHAPVRLSVDPDALLDKPLKLNGRNGELELTRDGGGALKLVKYTLLGEVVSKPAQACRIEIVVDAPIALLPQGEPDGLPRYSAAVPACPLTFDITDGAVLVPAQANACVFSAADCQASPSGLWGPEAADLDKDARAISDFRAAADRSIQDSLKALEKRDKDSVASLEREQNDFAAGRDDICHDYAGESRLGFCASRLAQSRAALLAKRVGVEEPEKRKRRKKESDADD
jgi:hypothetical protein